VNSYKKEKEKSQTAKFIVFGKGNQLRGAKNRKNQWKHQDVSFHMVLSVKNLPSQKCQGEGISANKKKFRFLQFLVYAPKRKTFKWLPNGQF